MRKVARRVGLSVLALVAAIAPMVIAASPAQAVTQRSVTVSKPYLQNWVFRSTDLKACMFVEISGSIVGTNRYAYYNSSGNGWDTRYYLWSNVRLANPKVTVKQWPMTSTGCDSTKSVTFTQMRIRQQWYESSCDLGVSIAVGAPWSISATPTYTCGTSEVADRDTTDPSNLTSYVQANSGYPVNFTGEILALATDALPFRANVTVTGYRTVNGVGVNDVFFTNRAVAYLKG